MQCLPLGKVVVKLFRNVANEVGFGLMLLRGNYPLSDEGLLSQLPL